MQTGAPSAKAATAKVGFVPHLTSSCVVQRKAAIPLFRGEKIPYRPILHSAGVDPEYRVTFPVGVDSPGKGPLPLTMDRYGLRGTPSLLLVDRKGVLSAHHLGQINPVSIGAEIATLVSKPVS